MVTKGRNVHDVVSLEIEETVSPTYFPGTQFTPFRGVTQEVTLAGWSAASLINARLVLIVYLISQGLYPNFQQGIRG